MVTKLLHVSEAGYLALIDTLIPVLSHGGHLVKTYVFNRGQGGRKIDFFQYYIVSVYLIFFTRYSQLVILKKKPEQNEKAKK
jgi:hypothetical protein